MNTVLEDAFERISFQPPRTYPEMRAWKDVNDNTEKLHMSEVFEILQLPLKKVMNFKDKLKNDNFNNSDRKKWAEYQRAHTMEIQYILSIIKNL